MKLFGCIVLLLGSFIATAQSSKASDQIRIPPGDLSALMQVMNDALEGDPNVETVIVTRGRNSTSGRRALGHSGNRHVFL